MERLGGDRCARDSGSSPPRRVDVDLTIDEDGDDEDDSDAELWSQIDGRPPAKKRKITHKPTAAALPTTQQTSSAATHRSPFFQPIRHQPNLPEPQTETTAVAQYKFSPSNPSAPQPTSSSETKKKQAIHDRARRILLSDSNILRPTFSALSERARDAYEAGSDVDDPDEPEEEPEELPHPNTQQEGTTTYEDVISFFNSTSSQGKGRGKGKAKGKGAKASQNAAAQPSVRTMAKQKAKAKEVGPSGQTWTPMELQVGRYRTETLQPVS